ncbi:MFS transporter [Streptomyces sp. NPDC035033]|uniref:MFS transporter n=1 Tax=Streptomyces sp. NPDC035033 TaxID=3155368 RepID=UPI0033EB7D4F
MAVDRMTSPPPVGTPRPPSARRAWLVVAALFVFMLLNYADKAVVGLVGVDLLRDLDIDESEFGLVQSAFFWPYAAGAVIGSLLVGRVRARWLLSGVAALWVLSLLPMVWSSSFTVLLVSRVLLGFAEGPAVAMAFSVAHSWFPAERRALPSSFIASGASAGPLVAAPVITAVVSRSDWHAAFAVTALAGLVWVACWLLIGRDGPEEVGHEGTPAARLPEHVPYRRLLTSPTIVGLTVLFLVAYASAAVKITWLPLALRQGLGYDAGDAGWVISLTYLATAVLMVVSGFVSRTLTRRGASLRVARGLLSCGLVAVGGLFVMAWPQLGRGPAQIAALAVGTSLVVAAQGASFAMVSDVVPARQRGTVLGVMTGCYSLGGVLAPLALGRLVDGAESPLAGYRTGFAVLGVVLLLGAAVAAWLIRPERDVAAFAAAAPKKSSIDG